MEEKQEGKDVDSEDDDRNDEIMDVDGIVKQPRKAYDQRESNSEIASVMESDFD